MLKLKTIIVIKLLRFPSLELSARDVMFSKLAFGAALLFAFTAGASNAAKGKANAVWTGWSTWGECSTTCGQGTRTRQRTCLRANENDGDCKGDASENESCLTAHCPLQAGKLKSMGSKVSYKEAKTECEAFGAQLPVLTSQAEHDALVALAKDQIGKNDEVWLGLYYTGRGNVYEWVDGTMTSSATFTKWVNKEPGKQDTGKAVILDVKDDGWRTSKETDDYYVICQGRSASAIAFQWESWGEWSTCSVTCGGGERSRSRRCVDKNSSREGSSQCQGENTAMETCNTESCAAIAWETWGKWSDCSVTCDGGQRSRSRQCIDSATGDEVQEKNGCPGKDSETENCSKDKCPEASWEEWDQWSACTSSCGKGTRSRTKQCSLDGAPASSCQGKDEEEKTCVMVRCGGLSKKEIVERIKEDVDDDNRLEKLMKWASSTQHMSESIFNSRSLTDWMLTGHVLRNVTVPSRMRCVLRCMGTEGCKSFNFKNQPDANGEYTCQLNSVNRDEGINYLERQKDYTLFDMEPFVPYV